VESFDDGLGAMDRRWGDIDLSTPGQVTLRGRAGEWADSGFMIPPTGAADGHGTWEIDFNPHGSTIGDYLLLWSSKDTWPEGEYDMYETNFDGHPYSAIHYPGSQGENQYDMRDYVTLPDFHGRNTVSMTWAETADGTPFVSLSLNGVLQYTTTQNIDPDFAHGGGLPP
jgi:hypothetical protein